MLLRFVSASILLTAIAATGCSTTVTAGDDDDQPDSTITVINNESFAITDIYIDPVGTTTFSDNLLGSDALLPGETTTFQLFCDTYDIELIDEADGDCILRNFDICLNDATIDIDDDFCDFSAKKTGAISRAIRTINPNARTAHIHK